MKASLVLVAAAAAVALGAPSAQASTTCTWAGSFTNPTGVFTISPGLTNLPSSQPLNFAASGVLAGGPRCHGTMTWIGDLAAGATCANATFEGRVYGLPGVYRFVGHGTLDVPSQLYDRQGDLVGHENAEILTPANLPHYNDCMTPEGFRGGWPGMFSSVVAVF